MVQLKLEHGPLIHVQVQQDWRRLPVQSDGRLEQVESGTLDLIVSAPKDLPGFRLVPNESGLLVRRLSVQPTGPRRYTHEVVVENGHCQTNGVRSNSIYLLEAKPKGKLTIRDISIFDHRGAFWLETMRALQVQAYSLGSGRVRVPELLHWRGLERLVWQSLGGWTEDLPSLSQWQKQNGHNDNDQEVREEEKEHRPLVSAGH